MTSAWRPDDDFVTPRQLMLKLTFELIFIGRAQQSAKYVVYWASSS